MSSELFTCNHLVLSSRLLSHFRQLRILELTREGRGPYHLQPSNLRYPLLHPLLPSNQKGPLFERVFPLAIMSKTPPFDWLKAAPVLLDRVVHTEMSAKPLTEVG